MTANKVNFDYHAGQSVRLIALKLPGVVTGCMQESTGIQYRVVWYWNGVRYSEWLNDFEIDTKAL